MVETQYLIPSKANQAEIRLSEHPANQAADDDSEGFQSAFASQPKMMEQRQEFLKPPGAQNVSLGGGQTFDTQSVENILPDMQVNTVMMEEAK